MTSTLQVNEDVVTLLGWPTDTVQIQHPTIQQQQQQQQRQQDRDETVLPSRSSETNPDTNDNKNKSNNKYYQTPHTILIFVPGNPGCIGWYKSTLSTLVERLGPGVVAYGVSYAGHSPHPSQTKIHIEEKEEENNEQQQQKKKRNPNKQSLRPIQVAWTIEGQVQHKIAFYDYIMMKPMMVNPKEEEDESHRNQQQKQSKLPKIIWLSHSIGGHLVERVLVLRKDIMKQTMGVLHIMPFIRMKAERLIDQWILDFGAGRTQWIISTTQRLLQTANGIHQRLDWFSQYLPKSIHSMISPTMIMMDDPKDQQLAIALLSQPWFVQNFFQLGMEELRDVSEIIDIQTLRYITTYCPMAMLYAAKDHWGPEFHVDELRQLLHKKDPQGRQGDDDFLLVPNSNYGLNVGFNPNLRHDYVSSTHMKTIVADWCYQQIHNFQSVQPKGKDHDERQKESSLPVVSPYRRSKL